MHFLQVLILQDLELPMDIMVIDAPGAEATFGLGAIYAQDEWQATSKIKVTYGIRIEKPFYFDDMQDNPAISALTFADGKKMDVSTWPESQLIFSPRFGFNYDVKGDRSLQVRGGTGLFTGLAAFCMVYKSANQLRLDSGS